VYKQKVQELFNLATVENHLKWPPWEGEWGAAYSQANAIAAVDWLNSNDIDARGHVLVWPGYDNLPTSVKNILNGGVTPAEQQPLRNLIENHIQDIGSEFAGQLVAWDVVNEPRTNHDIMDQLPEGDGAMTDWFDKARAVDSQAKLYVNEWGILASSGDTDSTNQQIYYDTIEDLKNQSAPIDGIGFQSHFDKYTFTGPVEVWDILDRFQELGLDMQVTEFDFNTDDETLQAMYTRDFLTAIFAHEGMDDFIMWGFWEGAHFNPDSAMFRNNWSIKPNGEAYVDLVFNQWWTDEDVAADGMGEALVRAFKGEHEVTVEWGEFSDMLAATLTDGGLELQIALPVLLGDYNRDGQTDAADYVVWRKSFGQSVSVEGSGADGNHNGIIDIGDLATWKAHFGAVMPSGSGAIASPEPSSLLLFSLVLALSCCVRQRATVRGLAR
jgi:GH35 family endo-1,4-beta-xylanase